MTPDGKMKLKEGMKSPRKGDFVDVLVPSLLPLSQSKREIILSGTDVIKWVLERKIQAIPEVRESKQQSSPLLLWL